MGSSITVSQYDSIGTKYDIIKTTAFNKLERHNFQRNVQPFLCQPNVSVIDFACGTGFYSHLLLKWGADSLTGVDISDAMIGGAEARLSQTPFALRAEFVQGNGFEPTSYKAPGSEGFDVATGAWFLNYAENKEQLTAMFQSISINLKQDGVFVGICYHPVDDVDTWASACNSVRPTMTKTGLVEEYRDRLENEMGHVVQIFGIPPPGSPPSVEGVEFETYHLKKSLFEECARTGGMNGNMEWRKIEFLGEEWRREMGLENDEEAWAQLQAHPQLSVLVVWKG